MKTLDGPKKKHLDENRDNPVADSDSDSDDSDSDSDSYDLMMMMKMMLR